MLDTIAGARLSENRIRCRPREHLCAESRKSKGFESQMCIELDQRQIARSRVVPSFLSALYTAYLKHADAVNVSGSLAGRLARVEPTLFQKRQNPEREWGRRRILLGARTAQVSLPHDAAIALAGVSGGGSGMTIVTASLCELYQRRRKSLTW